MNLTPPNSPLRDRVHRASRRVLYSVVLATLVAVLAACGTSTVDLESAADASYKPGRGHLAVNLVDVPAGAELKLSVQRCSRKASAHLDVAAAELSREQAALTSQSTTLSVTFENLKPGCYVLSTTRVRDGKGRFYNASVSSDSVIVKPHKTVSTDVTYTLEPFTVRDGKFYDPAGEVFLIKGANVQGRNFGWEDQDPLTHADNIVDEWQFNFIRVNEFVKGSPYCTRPEPASWCKPYWDRGATPEEHDALVDTFTSRDVVVMFEAHDWTGNYPNDEDLTKLIAWHQGLAERYKDNPYVWFNVFNEPGYNCQPVSPRWLEVHEAVITAIRETGNQNIVVADGSNFGQDRDCGEFVGPEPWRYSYKPKGNVPEEYSAILTYGPELASQFSNVAFSFHTYCIWTPTGDPSFDYEADSERAMNDYLDRVAAKDLAIFVGEFGSNGGGNCDGLPAARTTYDVTVPRNIGRVVWHWWGGDNNKLVYDDKGFRLNSPTDPTNLTQLGKLVWDDTHNDDGTGSVYEDGATGGE